MNEIYLINPSEKAILPRAGDRPPLGLMYIQANNKNTKIYDLNHDKEQDLFRDINVNKPKAVGISVYTSPIFKEAVNLSKAIRLLDKDIKLIAGGYHASVMPDSLLPYFDTVVIGEGEEVFDRALNNNGIISNGLIDLNNVKSPKGVNLINYGINQSGKKTGTIITSRGCPFDCSFCGKIYSKIRYEPIENVLNQIEDYKKANFEAIYFLDDVFTLNEDRMKSIVEQVKMPFRVTTRSDLINESKLEILARNGCEWLSMGIESGNNEILKKSNKRMTKEQNERAIILANKYGIKTKGFFIIGLPGETKETARQTIDFSLKLKNGGLTNADFYYLVPFPGTDIWRCPSRFGIEIIDRNYNNYLQTGNGAKCVINTKHLKSWEIENLIGEAKREWNKN
jgi:radical SAM superfamily enzyme YgiQ (UPF0313 family)